MGLKVLTLCHAAQTGKLVSVHSRGGALARVEKVPVPETENHPYPFDFHLIFEDGKRYTIYWDKYRQAHVFDEHREEVFIIDEEREIEINSEAPIQAVV